MIERIVADLHIHTAVSEHAFSSVYENILKAVEQQLTIIAITDHGPAMKDGASEGHFRNLRVIPREVKGVSVLRGIEANIINYEGHLDISEDTIKNRLDLCIASFHHEVCPSGNIESHTAAYMALAESKWVDIIGHSGSSEFCYDYEKVIKRFAQTDKVIEINEATFNVRPQSKQNCVTIAKLCKKYGVQVVLNTDAHFCTLVGKCPKGIKMLNELEFPKELVINSSNNNMARWLERRGIIL